MMSRTCLIKTLSLSFIVILALVGFLAAYYEQHILLHITALSLALSTVLPIYDGYRRCRSSRKAATQGGVNEKRSVRAIVRSMHFPE